MNTDIVQYLVVDENDSLIPKQPVRLNWCRTSPAFGIHASALRSGEAPLSYYIDITSHIKLIRIQHVLLLLKPQFHTHLIHPNLQDAPFIPQLQLPSTPVPKYPILVHDPTFDKARVERPSRTHNWSNGWYWRCNSALTRKPWLLCGTALQQRPGRSTCTTR
jgi:hypothetical protein